MKLLGFDHHAAHDLEALARAGSAHELRTVPKDPLIGLAQEIFPRDIWDLSVAYYDRANAAMRSAWARRVGTLLDRVHEGYPFEALILPSDTYFYVRSLVDWARDRGVATIVVQKETTVSPFVMATHAKAVQDAFPFACDVMTVCSERLKEFWVRAGTDPARIVVTGQPRFDLYRQPERWQSLESLGVPPAGDVRTILFLAYHRQVRTLVGVGFGDARPDEASYVADDVYWDTLRRETEQVLVDLVATGRYRVVVKPHPQQAPEEMAALFPNVPAALRERIVFLSGSHDARQLIVNADVVVGFQTTALYESIAAKKKTVCTFWSDEVEQFEDILIPFHQSAPGALTIARSPQQLRDAVEDTSEVTPEEEEARRRVWEEHLGPLDGGASRRVLDVVERTVDNRRAAFAPRRRRPHPFEARLHNTAAYKVALTGLEHIKRTRLLWRLHHALAPKVESRLRSLDCENRLIHAVFASR